MPNEHTTGAASGTATANAYVQQQQQQSQQDAANGSVERINNKPGANAEKLSPTDWEEEIAGNSSKLDVGVQKCGEISIASHTVTTTATSATAATMPGSLSATWQSGCFIRQPDRPVVPTEATGASAGTSEQSLRRSAQLLSRSNEQPSNQPERLLRDNIGKLPEPRSATQQQQPQQQGRRGRPPRSVGSNADNLATGATFYQGIYSTLNEFYRGQSGNNKTDPKDVAVSNELLNYYQLVRQFYEQSMSGNVLKPADNSITPNEPLNALNINRENSLLSMPTSENGSAHLAVASSSSTALENVKTSEIIEQFGANANATAAPVFAKSSKSQKAACKTTPPKKRYTEYNYVDESQKNEAAKTNLAAKFNVATLVPDCVSKSNGGTGVGAGVGQTLTVAKMDVDAQRFKSSPVGSNDSAVSMTDVKPITSTYLQLMRSMGLTDEDALKFDNLVSDKSFIYKFIINTPVDVIRKYNLILTTLLISSLLLNAR